MKKLIIVMILFSLNSCTSQTKKETLKKKIVKTIKKDTIIPKTHTMEYLNIKEYENFKKDTEFGNSEDNIQYILDDNKRIRISYYYDEAVSIEESSKTNPYRNSTTFNVKTKRLESEMYFFYDFEIGIWKNYNEQGKLIKETNYDLPYKFSVEDLKKKMLKEYNIDIMDVSKIFVMQRSIYQEKNLTTYQIMLKTSASYTYNEYLIDGITGETLFTDTSDRDEDEALIDRYLNKEAREKNLFKRYNGKDYTEEEWEAFEKTDEYKTQYKKEEWDKKSFWDKLSGN